MKSNQNYNNNNKHRNSKEGIHNPITKKNYDDNHNDDE